MRAQKVSGLKRQARGSKDPSVVRVREAREGDVELMVGLLGYLFKQEADFSPDPEKQRRALRQILSQPLLGRVFVLVRGEAVLGMVSLLFSISTAEGGKSAWLEDMVIRPDMRGKGLGTRLLQSAIEWARRDGITRVTLLTDEDNQGAQKLYTRHGFSPSAMRPYRLGLKRLPTESACKGR